MTLNRVFRNDLRLARNSGERVQRASTARSSMVWFMLRKISIVKAADATVTMNAATARCTHDSR
eukprot:2367683-Pleurochrysis_carterae.AAC.2